MKIIKFETQWVMVLFTLVALLVLTAEVLR